MVPRHHFSFEWGSVVLQFQLWSIRFSAQSRSFYSFTEPSDQKFMAWANKKYIHNHATRAQRLHGIYPWGKIPINRGLYSIGYKNSLKYSLPRFFSSKGALESPRIKILSRASFERTIKNAEIWKTECIQLRRSIKANGQSEGKYWQIALGYMGHRAWVYPWRKREGFARKTCYQEFKTWYEQSRGPWTNTANMQKYQSKANNCPIERKWTLHSLS